MWCGDWTGWLMLIDSNSGMLVASLTPKTTKGASFSCSANLRFLARNNKTSVRVRRKSLLGETTQSPYSN
jgi:hypothetical protein